MTTPAWQPGTLYPPGSLVRRTSAPTPTAQEIANPGFELGALTGWTTEGTGWSAATTPYQGAYSARWEPTSTSGTNGIGRIFATTAAPCRPGQIINASCMVKQGAADAGDAGGRVQLTWFDDAMVQLSISDGSNVNNSDSGNWRKSSVGATAPVGAAYVKLGARCFQEESGKKVHVDNFLWDHVYADNNSEGLVFRAVQADAGYSGATEPSWPLTLGVQVVDNEVTWEAVDSAYVTWEAVPILKSAVSEPDWPEQISAAVDDGTVRWIAVSRRVEDEKCPNTTAVLIAASKVFAVDEDIIAFSATINPLDWSTVEDAGYLPFGLQAHGSNPAKLLDAAPIGSVEPRAMQPVYNDLMFLGAIGVRNLSIAAGSTNLQAGSLGEPIDVLVKAQIDAGTYTPISVTFPSAGQYWLIFGPQAFVFTSVSSGKGTWSRYNFPAEITDATLLGSVLYLRGSSGEIWKFTEDEVADDVYCQGDPPVLDGEEYGGIIDLVWTYDYPEFDAETFRVLRSVDGSLFAEIGFVSGDTFTYSDTTALPGRVYTYMIVARPDPLEAIDSLPSNIVQFTLESVAPPPVLSGVMNAGVSELEWTAAGATTGTTIVAYQLWRADGTGDPVLIHTTDGVTLTYDDSDIVVDVIYTYFVIAVGSDEEQSVPSNSVQLTYSISTYVPAYWNNPNAELPMIAGFVQYWTNTLSVMRETTSYQPVPSGSWCFGAGSNPETKAYQDFLVVDTGINTALVDAGTVDLVVDWYGGRLAVPDGTPRRTRVNVHFYDGSNVLISTVNGTLRTPSTVVGTFNFGGVWGLQNFYFDAYQDVVSVPANTRRIRIELNFHGYSYGFIDAVYPYLTT
jgi:hypothetical protein